MKLGFMFFFLFKPMLSYSKSKIPNLGKANVFYLKFCFKCLGTYFTKPNLKCLVIPNILVYKDL